MCEIVDDGASQTLPVIVAVADALQMRSRGRLAQTCRQALAAETFRKEHASATARLARLFTAVIFLCPRERRSNFFFFTRLRLPLWETTFWATLDA
jgi:hypothetical protein